jgi:hypothetical protein
VFLVCSVANAGVFGKAGRGCETGPAYSFYQSLALYGPGRAVVFEVHSYNGNDSHEEIRQLVCVVCSKLILKAANESSITFARRKGQTSPTNFMSGPIAFRVSSAKSVTRTSAD